MHFLKMFEFWTRVCIKNINITQTFSSGEGNTTTTRVIYELKYLRKLKRNTRSVFFCCSVWNKNWKGTIIYPLSFRLKKYLWRHIILPRDVIMTSYEPVKSGWYENGLNAKRRISKKKGRTYLHKQVFETIS